MSQGYNAMLDYLIQFATGITSAPLTSTTKQYGQYHATEGFHTVYAEDLRVGDLVRIQALNDPEWRLCWYEGFSEDSRPGNPELLVTSCSTGRPGKLSNIGYVVYNRETLKNHPEWKWTDGQWDFRKKWLNAVDEEDSYVYRATQPVFNEDGSVVLGVRVIHTNADPKDTRTLTGWADLSNAELTSVYQQLVNQLKEQRK